MSTSHNPLSFERTQESDQLMAHIVAKHLPVGLRPMACIAAQNLDNR
jgi:hypothetical protein